MADELRNEVTSSHGELSGAAASDLSTTVREEDRPTEHGSVIAAHYNTLREGGVELRYKSRILHLRNFNNWVKSILIGKYIEKVKQGKHHASAIKVLDIGCGKGGDLIKWEIANIRHIICADIAKISIEQCESRYNVQKERNKHNKYKPPIFSAEFIYADCSKVRLREKYHDPSIELDLVSCQFAFHYCFESYLQAKCMLRNVSECLRPKGYFIGTIPDANEIISRLQQSGKKEFGNDIYKIEFFDDALPPPLFGAKYNFHLEGVVDCPEFLVHFPTLVKLAEKYDLELIYKERFQDFFLQHEKDGKHLLSKMQALEIYPPCLEVPLMGRDPEDYIHVQQHLQNKSGHRKVGTISKSEWEVASLYITFAFQKKQIQK